MSKADRYRVRATDAIPRSCDPPASYPRGRLSRAAAGGCRTTVAEDVHPYVAGSPPCLIRRLPPDDTPQARRHVLVRVFPRRQFKASERDRAWPTLNLDIPRVLSVSLQQFLVRVSFHDCSVPQEDNEIGASHHL